jgi:hypothetical protein
VPFFWRVLVSMMKEVCMAIKCSRNSTCSIIVLCVKRPLVVTSRYRSTSIQKRLKIMPLGNDKSRPACSNVENLAQAAPIDSSHVARNRGSPLVES